MINEIKDTIIKMNLNLAQSLCETNGIICRLVKQDGLGKRIKLDARPDRINVVVENDIVVEAYIG